MKADLPGWVTASVGAKGERRSFLFLQGPASPFFAHLAERLEADGHRVFKVHFNAGDALYWRRGNAHFFRGELNELPAFIVGLHRAHGITDQVLFGDCRPVHVPAIEVARRAGIRNHVCEEGYFRPYWFTLEREGVNLHSLLPRDPAWFRATAKRLPAENDAHAFTSSFMTRACHDVAYHLAGASNPLLVPHYRTHARCSALHEYLGYMRRLPMLKIHAVRDVRVIQGLLRSRQPFYFVPLQLNGDTQIREHSPFNGMDDFLHEVMGSFARHAASDARLIIKNHPLDMWELDYQRIIRDLEKKFDLIGRVDYLETGSLPALLRNTRGVVTVNSTVGTLALTFGAPTIALGGAMYNLPGMTYQGTLDDFWKHAEQPDAELVQDFRRVVIHATQLNGGLHNEAGIALAVENAAHVLLAERSRLECLL